MKKSILLLAAAIYTSLGFGQNTFKVITRDSLSGEALVGVTVALKGTANGRSTDVNGKAELKNIPDGVQVFVFSYVGYLRQERQVVFPLTDSTNELVVLLQKEEEEMEEVIVSSTRSSRTIENIPTRVETISGEELEEKGNMKPGDIRMMLNESTGIQTQQTSATSYNSSIRIQGLDGKYTQILKDGMPLYSGFSGGLSLLQIVPLDLQQVEVIKGASSTLYGGGAIAGLVNLISKTPKEERELNFMFNGTSALGLDASGFYAKKFGKTGTTVFASYNAGSPYDPANIGFTAIPKFERFTLNPRMFFYFNDKTTLNVGFNSTAESRVGGDMKYIEGQGDSLHSYFEKNNTNRFSTQLVFERKTGNESAFVLKNSWSYYDRSIKIPGYRFSGVQYATFTEANYSFKGKKHEWVTGLNVWTDKFQQNKLDTTPVVDYSYVTTGLFVQNTWSMSDQLTLETGLRGDYQDKYGFFVLPRLSLLWKPKEQLAMRLGGGLGYKSPTVFSEDAERIHFRNVLPVKATNTTAEQSVGGNFDINYKTPLSEKVFLNLNTLFFYTRVNNPLVLTAGTGGMYSFMQPGGYIDTKGIETNIKLSFGDFKLFIGHTLADVKQHFGTTSTFPLVAKNRLNNVLMYEIEEKLKIGLEAYYFSPQKLSDGTTGKQYWVCGFMVEKLWEHFSVFINFENFTDSRQTRFDTIYKGSVTNPVFRDIYAPVDGFVMNGGLKLKL